MPGRYGAAGDENPAREDILPDPPAQEVKTPPQSEPHTLAGAQERGRTIGLLENPGRTLGILLSGDRPSTWTVYLDLTATGTEAILFHNQLQLLADGSAIFEGSVDIGNIDADSGIIDNLLTNYFENHAGTDFGDTASRIEMDEGKFRLKGDTDVSPVDGQSRLVTLGRYSQSVGGGTESAETDTWSTGDTASGETNLQITDSGSDSVAAGSRMQNSVVASSSPSPAFDGLYYLNFQIGHLWTKEPGDPDPVFTEYTTTITVEYSTDGGSSWSDGPSRQFNTEPSSNNSEVFTTFNDVEVDIGDTSPTDVDFRLKHEFDVTVKLSVGTFTNQSTLYVYDSAGGGSHDADAFDITWTSLSGGSTQTRAGLRLFSATDRPHWRAVPLASLPADSDGAEGDYVDVSGDRLYRHDGDAYEEFAYGKRGTWMFKSGTQSIPDDGAWHQVEFDSTRFDFGTADLGNDQATVPTGQAGLWLIIAQAFWASNATGQRRARVWLNGFTALDFDRRVAESSGSPTVQELSVVVDLSDGDDITLEVRQDSGGNLNLNNARSRTQLIMVKLW